MSDKPFSAFLENYVPSVQKESFLDKYLIEMGIKSSSNVGDVLPGWEIYVEALERHFHRLETFLAGEDEALVNLVYGNVQSGKTGHLLANICWARDNGFHLAIVLTGSVTALGEQTVERLRSKLPQNTAYLISAPTESRLTGGNIVSEITSHVKTRSLDSKKPLPVVTLIKSAERLKAVKSIIQDLNSNLKSPLKIILLDDEADQASVDASQNGRSNVVQEVVLSQNSSTRVSIHNRINEIRNEIEGKLIYLAYTATPQALMHGDLYGPLQPRICSVVPAGDKYVSIGDLARTKNTLIQLKDVSTGVSSDENLIAMEQCLVQFLIHCWLHKRWPSIFHGKSLNENYKCEENSLQFLIHPSGLSNDHTQFKEAMDQCLQDFRKFMHDVSLRLEFVEQYFEPAYGVLLSQMNEKERDFILDEKQKIDCWDYVINLIDSTDKLKVKLVNYKERQNLNAQGANEPLIPINPDQWQVAEAWILIGGEILGRGLSIPHLSTTLFLRNPKNPLFDTAVQQMRFCGYRSDYLRFIQVFAPADIIQDYRDAVEIDEPFRLRALKWDLTNRDLIKNPPIMRFIAPITTRFRPTRGSVLSGQIQVRNSSGKSGLFSVAQIASPVRLVSNADLVIDLLNASNLFETYVSSGTRMVIHKLEIKDAKHLLDNFKVSPSEVSDLRSLSELLEYDESERGLANSNILLAVDESILEYTSGEDLFNRLVISEDLPFRTLSGEIDPNLWANCSEDAKMLSVQAKSIVGDSERNVHKKFSSSILLQVRLYRLLSGDDLGHAAQNREDFKFGVGVGLSLIGWIPDTQEEYYVNREASLN